MFFKYIKRFILNMYKDFVQMYLHDARENSGLYKKIKYTLGILLKTKCTRHTNKRYEENLWFNIGLNNYNRPPN